MKRPVDVVDLGVECIRQGRQQTDHPNDGHDAHCALETRHGFGVQRVANGQIALHREGDDGQNGGIGGPVNNNIKKHCLGLLV